MVQKTFKQLCWPKTNKFCQAKVLQTKESFSLFIDKISWSSTHHFSFIMMEKRHCGGAVKCQNKMQVIPEIAPSNGMHWNTQYGLWTQLRCFCMDLSVLRMKHVSFNNFLIVNENFQQELLQHHIIAFGINLQSTMEDDLGTH